MYTSLMKKEEKKMDGMKENWWKTSEDEKKNFSFFFFIFIYLWLIMINEKD